jgi:hypothetical protein
MARVWAAWFFIAFSAVGELQNERKVKNKTIQRAGALSADSEE